MIERPAAGEHALFERCTGGKHVVRRAASAAVGALDRHAAIMAVRPQRIPEHPGVGLRRAQRCGKDQHRADDRAFHMISPCRAKPSGAIMGRDGSGAGFERRRYTIVQVTGYASPTPAFITSTNESPLLPLNPSSLTT